MDGVDRVDGADIMDGANRMIAGNPVVAQQSYPDSMTTDALGNIALTSQADGDLIFLSNPGFPNL